MSDWGSGGRDFERALARGGLRSALGDHAGRDEDVPAITHYGKLVTVDFRHSYYGSRGQACSDLTVSPTAATKGLIRSLGLILRAGPAGFSVLFDAARGDMLLRYLEQHARGKGPEHRHWTRMSFAISVHNPQFVNMTDLPERINPLTDNFYLSNQRATGDAADALLDPSGFEEGRKVPVFPQTFTIRVPRGGKARIRDLARRIVWSWPAVHAGSRPAPALTGPESTVEVNLVRLPEDRYDLTIEDAGGEVVTRSRFLYTTTSPVPLFFVDLLLTNPTGSAPGIYPVLRGAGGEPAQIAPVHYRLQFEARAPQWCYFVVLPGGDARFTDVRLEALSPRGVEFFGPVAVDLPTGKPALMFGSTAPIPLADRSTVDLRLWGRRGRSAEREVLVARMPVASPEGVRPMRRAEYHGLPGEPKSRVATTRSDVYVYV